jgi:hypothetical protein
MLSNQAEFPVLDNLLLARQFVLGASCGVAARKLNRRGFGGFPMKFTPQHVDSGYEYYPCVSVPGACDFEERHDRMCRAHDRIPNQVPQPTDYYD